MEHFRVGVSAMGVSDDVRRTVLTVGVMLLALEIPSGILSLPVCNTTFSCTVQVNGSCRTLKETYQHRLPDGPLLHRPEGADDVRISGWTAHDLTAVFDISWALPSTYDGQHQVTSFELGLIGYTTGGETFSFPEFYIISANRTADNKGRYSVRVSCSCSERMKKLRVMLTSVLGSSGSCDLRQWAMLLDFASGLPSTLEPVQNVTFHPNEFFADDALDTASGFFTVAESVAEGQLEQGSCDSNLEKTTLTLSTTDSMTKILKVAQEPCKLYCLTITVSLDGKPRYFQISYILPRVVEVHETSTLRPNPTPTLSNMRSTHLTRAVNGAVGVTPSASPRMSSWQPTSPNSSSSPLLPLSSSSRSSFSSRSHDSSSTELSRQSPSHHEDGRPAHLSTRLVERSHSGTAESAWPPEPRDTLSPGDNSSDVTTSSLSSGNPRSEFGETNSSSILFLSPSVDPQQTVSGEVSLEAQHSSPSPTTGLHDPSTSKSAVSGFLDPNTWSSVVIAGGLIAAALLAVFLAGRQIYRRRQKTLRWQEDRPLKDACSCFAGDAYSMMEIDSNRCRSLSTATTTQLFVLHRTVDKERLRNVRGFLRSLEGAVGEDVKLQEVLITSCASACFWPSGGPAGRIKVVLLLSSAVRNILKDVNSNGGSCLSSWRRCIMQEIPYKTSFYFFVLLSHDVLKNDDVKFFRSALPVERIFEIGSWECEQFHALVDDLLREEASLSVVSPDFDNLSFFPPQSLADDASVDACNELQRMNDASDLWSGQSSKYSPCTV